MKKPIIMSALTAIIGFSACAQKLDESRVPAAVKTAFAAKYTGLMAKWEKEDGRYEATFKQNGNKMSAMFAPNGMFTESEMDIKLSDLPAGILAYVKEHYPGKSVKDAAKITRADGTVNYEAGVNGKDVLFDAGSKFLKEVKD